MRLNRENDYIASSATSLVVSFKHQGVMYIHMHLNVSKNARRFELLHSTGSDVRSL